MFLLLYIKERDIHVDFALTRKKYLVAIGFLMVIIYQIGYMYGETFTTGTEASLLIATIPIAVFIISITLLKYKITAKHVIGVFAGFLGVLVVILFETSSSSEAPNSNLGNILIIMAVIAFAFYSILLKQLNKYFTKSDS